MPTARRHNQSPVTRVLGTLASDAGLVAVIVLVLLSVYLIDTVSPLGEPVWLLYFIPLVLSYWSNRFYAIPTVCAVTLLFLIGGFLVSPEGVPVTQAVLYRFTFFLAFIGISAVLWVIRRRQIADETIV